MQKLDEFSVLVPILIMTKWPLTKMPYVPVFPFLSGLLLKELRESLFCISVTVTGKQASKLGGKKPVAGVDGRGVSMIYLLLRINPF